MKANQDIRKACRVNDVVLWEVAKALSIHEVTLVRWLRVPLTPEKHMRVMTAITKAAAEKEGVMA